MPAPATITSEPANAIHSPASALRLSVSLRAVAGSCDRGTVPVVSSTTRIDAPATATHALPTHNAIASHAPTQRPPLHERSDGRNRSGRENGQGDDRRGPAPRHFGRIEDRSVEPGQCQARGRAHADDRDVTADRRPNFDGFPTI